MSATPPEDDELAELFAGRPDLLELAGRARAGRPEAPLAPNFQGYLRARIVDAASRTLRQRPPLHRRLLGRRGGPGLALAASAVGAAMIVVGVASTLHGGGGGNHEILAVRADVQGETRVDPGQAIHIAFSQPMDHTSVERALRIEPATRFTATWQGNTLTITPTNRLAASTAYRVTISNTVARPADPLVAPLAKPIVVTFGTRSGPAPTPSAAPIPRIDLAVVGPVDPSSALAILGSGSLVAGSAPTPAIAPPAAAGSSAASPSASPAASPTAAPAGGPAAAQPPGPAATPTPTAPAGAGSSLVRLGAGASPSGLGPAATAVAVAPGGRLLAALVDQADGTAAVVVMDPDGHNRHTVAGRADPLSPLAWQARSAVVFVADGRLRAVDVTGSSIRNLAPNVRVPSASGVTLSPDGRRALVRAEDGSAVLTDLGPVPGATMLLPSPVRAAAFSGEGTRLVWIDDSGPAPALRALSLPAPGASTSGTTPASPRPAAAASAAAVAASPQAGGDAGLLVTPGVAGPAAPVTPTPAPPAATISLGDAVTAVHAVALDPAGDLALVTVTRPDGTGEMRLLTTAGRVVETAPGDFSAPALDGAGQLAAVRRTSSGAAAVVGAVPGQAAPTGSGLPPAADTLIDELIAAQTGGGDLASLPVAGSPAPDLVALTPAGFTEGYVIAESRSAADDTVSATIRLVKLPTDPSQPVSVGDETVTLSRLGAPAPGVTAATGYAVAGLSVSPPADLPQGPQVVHVGLGGTVLVRYVQVSFNSDLDPASVPAAIHVSVGGLQLSAPVTYDVPSRTATVLLPALPPGLLTVAITVDTGLRDVDGEALAAPYVTTLRG